MFFSGNARSNVVFLLISASNWEGRASSNDTELLFFVFLYGGVFFSSEVALIPGSVLVSISAYFFLVLFYSPGVFVFVFRYSHVYLEFFS